MVLRPITWKDKILSKQAENEIRGIVEYHKGLFGKGLRYQRNLIVWLPPSYKKNKTKRYPVVYMHDGQNLFDPTTSFSGYDWRMDEVADSLITLNKIEEIIIVGINNTADRLEEYSDSELGNAYIDFLISTIKPFIDLAYRTKPDKKNSAIIGSSMGGLISLLCGWRHPEVFGKVGALSTSFWYDDQKTLREFIAYSGKKKNISIYVDCGGREKELIGDYKTAVVVFKKLGYKEGHSLEYFLDETGTHNERSWAKRVWRPLLFFFGKKETN